MEQGPSGGKQVEGWEAWVGRTRSGFLLEKESDQLLRGQVGLATEGSNEGLKTLGHASHEASGLLLGINCNSSTKKSIHNHAKVVDMRGNKFAFFHLQSGKADHLAIAAMLSSKYIFVTTSVTPSCNC